MMKVLVDTCVWSKALRHKNVDKEITQSLKELINKGSLVIIGPVRQELLSGVADTVQFNKLKDLLSPFEDVPLRTEHFIKAAELCNLCRKKGVQGSAIDFLICAVAVVEHFAVSTTDKDFDLYSKHLPLALYNP